MTVIKPVSAVAPPRLPRHPSELSTVVTWIESRVSSLEAVAKADVSSAETWIKANWPHFITWAGTAWLIVKHVL